MFFGRIRRMQRGRLFFGFRKPGEKAGFFLASKEKFKKQVDYGNAFYKQIDAEKPREKYLILCNLDRIDDDINVEVVNYWGTPLVLSGLVTLANFDSPANGNVIAPFASGCRSMWTIPFKEKKKKHPKAVIGTLDPAMRKYVPSDPLMYSVPASRFNAMAENIRLSFAGDNKWMELI